MNVKKLSDMEIGSIKMYRIHGICIGELSKMFNCSVGIVYNITK
ncbi:hypothetical protein [Clostridium thermobutyricum]|nr:hypothetical protein [Clostridium thermobutyricum]